MSEAGPDASPTIAGDVRDALRLALQAWKPLVLYGLVTGVLGAVVLAPALSWLLFKGLTLAAGGTLLNYDLLGLLSLKGILLLLLWSVVTSLLTIWALGGPVLITAAVKRGQGVLIRPLLWRVLSAMARVPGHGALQFALLVFIVLPVVVALAGAIGALLLLPFGGGPTLDFLDRFGPSALLIVLLVALGAGAFFLYVRWGFSVHSLCLEEKPLSAAMKRSVELVRPARWPTARTLLVFHLVMAALVGVLSLLIGGGDRVALRAAGGDPSDPAFRVVLALLLVVNTVVLGVAVALAVGAGVALHTLLYERLGGKVHPRVLGIVSQPRDPERVKRSLARIFAMLGVALGALGLATFLTMQEVETEMATLRRPIAVTAHRGSSGEAPENTLAALRLAMEDRADYAEIDVQQAKDGAVMMVHDSNLTRTAGLDRNVWEMTGADLREVDVGAWFGAAFVGERIVSLADAIRLVRGTMKLNIELKTHGHETASFARDAVAAIQTEGFVDHCVVTSLDYPLLQEVKRLDPKLRVGMIITAKVGRASALDVDFYSVQPAYATVAFIRRAHADGREVHVWTLDGVLNDRPSLVKFIKRHVDNVITDYPRLAREILDERTETDDVRSAVQRLFQD